jgi:hypothetical protein
MGSKDEDDKDAKAVAESLFHSSPGTPELEAVDSALVVAGYPTSMEHDPTTQVLEELDSRNVDVAMVKLVSETGEVPKPGHGSVYNAVPSDISEDVLEAHGELKGDKLVLGYCAGGVYALEALDDQVGFVGMDVPTGIENWYKGVLAPDAPDNSVFLYDEAMKGMIEAPEGREFEVSGTEHLWQDTPEDLGEAAVYLGDAAASGEERQVHDFAATYDWLDSGHGIPVETPTAKSKPDLWRYKG